MLIGNTGSEPEVRTTGSGTKVAKFSLATNRQWTDRSGQKQEKTEWHRITAWDKLAQLVEDYVHKGDRLYIEGSIEYSQTESDGTTRYWTDIVVRELIMLGEPRESEGRASGDGRHARNYGGTTRTQPAGSGNPFDYDDDDLPF
jgi:single-strand DNA-binding protein